MPRHRKKSNPHVRATCRHCGQGCVVAPGADPLCGGCKDTAARRAFHRAPRQKQEGIAPPERLDQLAELARLNLPLFTGKRRD